MPCNGSVLVMYIPPSPALNLNATLIGNDTINQSSIGMIAVQIYAFGGLAFMIGTVLYSLGFWVWTVIIRREWANSPPEIELHPERMREKERSRQERLKRKKAEKQQRTPSHNFPLPPEKPFTPPPIRLNPRKSSIANRSSTRVPDQQPTQRKSSLSTSPSKGLRVSWASSAATLDVDGHASEKLIETGSKASSLLSIKFPFDDAKSVASSVDVPAPIPRARTSIPRHSTSIAARAPRADEMIATTTADICESWSKPTDPFLVCRCWDSVGPLDKRNYAGCDIHRYRD